MPGEEALLAGLSGSNMGQLGGQALNMATNVGSMAYNYWLWMKQAQYNRQNMAMQNMWNIQQWERENAYNTPLAQMQRLQAAGINPALAYSNGQLMNEAAQSPTMEMNQLSGAPYVDPLSLSTARLQNAQADELTASAELKRSELPLAEQQISESKQRIANMIQDIEESNQRISTMSQDRRESERRIVYSKFRQMLEGKEWYDLHSKIKSEININKAEFDRLTQSLALYLQGLRSDINYKNKLAELTDGQSNLTQEEYVKALAELKMLGITVGKDGTVTFDPNSPAAVEAGRYKRHTVLYKYAEDYFRMLGQIFSASASTTSSSSQIKKVAK